MTDGHSWIYSAGPLPKVEKWKVLFYDKYFSGTFYFPTFGKAVEYIQTQLNKGNSDAGYKVTGPHGVLDVSPLLKD